MTVTGCESNVVEIEWWGPQCLLFYFVFLCVSFFLDSQKNIHIKTKICNKKISNEGFRFSR